MQPCVFLPHITKLLNNASRVDIVWVTYIPTNIKADRREKRGKGVRQNVAGKEISYQAIGKVFLREEANKEELFHFLSEKVASSYFDNNKEIYATFGTGAVVAVGTDIGLLPCNHEEADTRIGLIRTVDTDVIVILLGNFISSYPSELMLTLGGIWGWKTSDNYWHINEVHSKQGPEKSLSLPFFHNFSGCDTTSS